MIQNIAKKISVLLLASCVVALSAISAMAETKFVTGAADMREAKVKAFTPETEFGKDGVKCLVKGKNFERTYAPEKVRKINGHYVSDFVLFGLQPGNAYEISAIDGNVVVAKGTVKTAVDFVERFPAPDFSFAVFGANYANEKNFDPPFRTNGGNYEIFEKALKKKPEFAIWIAGLDTLRRADAGSKSGIAARCLTAVENPQLARAAAAQANYGVLSSELFGLPSDDASTAARADAVEVFDLFWSNPSPAIEGVRAYTFRKNDAQFFVLDDCSEKSFLDYKKDFPCLLGKRQMFWLKSALQNSDAKFKFIVVNSPAANPVKARGNLKFSPERDELVAFLTEKKIGGVVFISGGKPYGEVTKMVRAGAYPLFDITVPPATARPAKQTEELNYFRVPNSGIFSRGFALISVDGTENSRTLTANFVLPDGTTAFSFSLKETDLYKFE